MINKLSTICYKIATPIIYNEGTEWETSCDTFLNSYSYKKEKELQEEIDRLNAAVQIAIDSGAMAESERKTYFADKQEAMY